MNDPNGLVYLDGEYHMFYQYNPSSSDWGDIGWGHAVSRDLIRWLELPAALPADNQGMAFSGSAVVDLENSSGLADGDIPTIVALYTRHAVANEQARQSQHLAYSTDRGHSWHRYADNPVLDIGSASFRDPKVFWHDGSRRWIMAIVLASECQVRFYGSRNLLQWQYLSSFGPAGNTQGDWECPDLMPLPVDDDPQRIKWLLKIDNTLGGAAGGSGGQYFVGTFDGTHFAADPIPASVGETALPMQPLDYGSDFYAAMSWSNLPDDRRLWLGWMSNWRYAGTVPTRPFRGIQSLPRSLHLVSRDDRVHLAQRPVEEVDRLRGPHVRWSGVELASGMSLLLDDDPAAAMELSLRLAVQPDTKIALRLHYSSGSVTSIVCDTAADHLCVDRRRTSADAFHADFAGCHCAPLPLIDGIVELRLLFDDCCLEVFGGQGEIAISDLLFSDGEAATLQIDCDRGTADIKCIDLWHLNV